MSLVRSQQHLLCILYRFCVQSCINRVVIIVVVYFNNLASPSAPKDFKVVEVTRHHVHLTWEAPEHDGGSPVIGYNIEKREVSRKTWVKVSTSVTLAHVYNNDICIYTDIII